MKQEFYGRNGLNFTKKSLILATESSSSKLPPIDKPYSQKSLAMPNSNSLSFRKQSSQTPKNLQILNHSQYLTNQLFLTSHRKNQNLDENSSINKVKNFYNAFHSFTPTNKSQNKDRTTIYYNPKLKPLSLNRNPQEPSEAREKKYQNFSQYFEKTPIIFNPLNKLKKNIENHHSEEQPYQPQQRKQITINELDNFFQFKMPALGPSRHSQAKTFQIKCFAANTHQGLIRNYNEDRVSIVLNITKPNDKVLKQGETWPRCSFFSVYDGHGGKKCADFLRDHLHQFIINESTFPSNPTLSIQSGCQKAEEQFLKYAEQQTPIERSGSCANFILIIDTTIYSCNVGDSRALVSYNNGKRIEQLTIDHKPDESNEQKRIMAAGGKVYQSQGPKIVGTQFNGAQLVGPYRVFPGRLSVSRTFGDIEAKQPKYGGNSQVIICTPEIKKIEITNELDYIIIACDGVFDKMSNNEVAQAVNEEKEKNYQGVHEFAARAVENVIQNSFLKKTFDNVTAVFVGFKNLKKNIGKKEMKNLLTLNEQMKPIQNSAFFQQISKLTFQKNPQKPHLSPQDK